MGSGATGGGELAELVEEVHGGQVGRGQLTRALDAGGPRRRHIVSRRWTRSSAASWSVGSSP
jgi:hypothetical protein